MEAAVDIVIVLRALAAILAGALLGLPYRKRPGGVSTHALVALGAFVYCSIARSLDADGDVLRIVQGIAQGVGFVGAAAVLKTRHYIVGITTAASIWIAGAVGSFAALGDPMLALAFGLLAMLTNIVLRSAERRYLSRSRKMPIPADHEGAREEPAPARISQTISSSPPEGSM